MTQPVMSRESEPASRALFAIAPLCEAKDVEGFANCLAEAAAAILGTRQTFAVLCDRSTGELELASLRALAHTPQVRGFLQSYRAPQPGRGTAAISTDVISASGLWMIPVTHDSRTEAFAGVLTRSGDRPASDQVENLRALSRLAGPFIAALRDAQRLRRKVRELEARLQIRSGMLCHLSHEFRSLLAAVRGYAKRMADGRAGAIGEAARQHLDVILRNTGKLLDLASHTLPFVAEQALRIDSFDLREPLESALKRMRGGESEEFPPVTLQIPAEPFLVTGDRERLAVVFGILLTSAAEGAAAPASTTIQFLRSATEDVTVKIFAGRELPQPVVDSIFAHHAESALPRDEPVAPGFSLVHDLIWLHGGRITVTSRPGEGAVFLFTLPSGQTGTESADGT